MKKKYIALIIIVIGLLIASFAFAGHEHEERHENHHSVNENTCVEQPIPSVIPPEVPPIVTPPVELPVSPPNNPLPPTPPVEIPPISTSNNLATSGGGGGSVCVACITGIQPKPQWLLEPQISSQNQSPAQEACIPLTDFKVETGVSGDGKVHLSYKGSGSKFIIYGRRPEELNQSVTTDNNEIDITSLAPLNYWFQVFNDCSKTELIDPIP